MAEASQASLAGLLGLLKYSRFQKAGTHPKKNKNMDVAWLMLVVHLSLLFGLEDAHVPTFWLLLQANGLP